MDIRKLTFGSRDEFQRKKIADQTIALLQSGIDVSPMVIDGSWGTGKTEFCHKLMNLMREQDSHQIVYIDAFKADHANEPLMSVLAEVIKLIPDEDGKKGFKDKALPVLRFGAKAVGKAVVSHLLRQDAADVVEEFDDAIQQTADKAIDATVESVLKDHVEAEKNLKALQDALEAWAAQKPIVLFVDELDRCRPDFAVDMLEIIKHTFDVPGVQFVLVTNTQQLKASISHCYGPTVDTQRYLDKFLKFSFGLPSTFKINGHELLNASINHAKSLLDESDILSSAEICKDASQELINQIIEINNLSLREVETLIRHLAIYQILTGEKGLSGVKFGYKLIRIWAVALFTFHPKVAQSIANGQSDAEKIGILFNETRIIDWNGDYPYPQQYHALLVALGQECSKNAGSYEPTEEAKPHWESYFNGLFQRHGFPPRAGSRLKILADAIQTMTLIS
ncbi:KAP family NTPase [Neiella marina]|uniref:KAP family NTPase n=1 Tax=Neiella holothuriorum TaxID=2870530 RepID=A0ABS7EHX8_9GAMM|nr:KAP family NTPase [Neiella holothuriorum]MBW8191825.1 KAP family NTPase [Neiella holothuriorum]